MNMPIEVKFRAFLTGSHAYGIPRHDSDIDLVVYLSEDDLKKLNAYSEQEELREKDLAYIEAGSTPVRFGRLNLICCTDEEYYDVWKKGTKKLKKMAPVTRDFAIKYMAKLREEEGFTVNTRREENDKEIPF